MTASPSYGIIVHCHLRWDFVWQRPQHLMSRLSKFHPVLFLEDGLPLEPGPDSENQPRMDITHVSDTLTVARPRLIPRTGDPARIKEIDATNEAAFLRLLDTTVHGLQRENPDVWKNVVHWMYTPMAVWLKERFEPVAVAYDCMDELANFKDAVAELKQKEAELMQAADVVFTGGPSMYQARKDKHANVHQFNSGVDVTHFQKALASETTVPDDAKNLSHPVLMYYGVIDERMGWDNIASVCDAHPDWSVLMVGPLAKITEADLLRRPNLHYTGQRGYDTLPGYLKGCDIALVPFALSDATRYLSPTKTLEYFAARRPVVATPIQDIVDFYTDAASIAHTPDEFVRACEETLAQVQNGQIAPRLDAGEQHAQANTWDNIVEQMRTLLDEAVAKNAVGTKRSAGDTGEPDETHPATSNPTVSVVPDRPDDVGEMAVGQVRWYSGSRGAGVVDTDEGDEVMAFLPGEAQADLGAIREGDSVAVGVAGPAHTNRGGETGTNMFPLGLDALLGNADKRE